MSDSLPVYRFDSFIVRTPSPSVVNGLRADDRGNSHQRQVENTQCAPKSAAFAADVVLRVIG